MSWSHPYSSLISLIFLIEKLFQLNNTLRQKKQNKNNNKNSISTLPLHNQDSLSSMEPTVIPFKASGKKCSKAGDRIWRAQGQLGNNSSPFHVVKAMHSHPVTAKLPLLRFVKVLDRKELGQNLPDAWGFLLEHVSWTNSMGCTPTMDPFGVSLHSSKP